jgi:hypothetical protein
LLLAAGLLPQNASAHGFVGDRFFPATIVVDDPAVADELSLPTVSNFKNGDNTYETDISAEWSKRITEHFGVSISPDWTHLSRGGNGFQNLETTAKYQLITDAKTEFMLSVGFSVEWGNTEYRSRQRRGRELQYLLAANLFRQRTRGSARGA